MKKALLIGIDYFDISGITLKGCINDIINMRNMLIDAYDYNSEDIIMLRDDDNIKFKSPTYSNILETLTSIVKESNILEEFWLHYSGHGSIIQNNNSKIQNNIEDNKEEFIETLIPINYKDSGVIFDYELLNIIKNLKCTSILLFDCCHSGTVCDLPFVFEYNNNENVINKNKINDIIIENPNIFMISSCRDDQTSSDTTNLLDQNVGAFTNSFLECLRKSHHNIDILSLYKNICIDLIQNGYSQIPVLSSTTEELKYKFCKYPNT